MYRKNTSYRRPLWFTEPTQLPVTANSLWFTQPRLTTHTIVRHGPNNGLFRFTRTVRYYHTTHLTAESKVTGVKIITCVALNVFWIMC